MDSSEIDRPHQSNLKGQATHVNGKGSLEEATHVNGTGNIEESELVLRMLNILKHVTLFVKVYPFVNTSIFLATMLSYRYCEDSTCTLLDLLFYTSPLTVLLLLILSKLLKMCFWHKIQCILPIPPLLIGYIDEYIYEYSKGTLLTYNSILLLIVLLSLVNGYRIFIHKNKKGTD